MIFFWKSYQNSKLASLVSALASLVLYMGIFMVIAGIGVLVEGDLTGIALILAGGVMAGLFFLLRKKAKTIAINKAIKEIQENNQ